MPWVKVCVVDSRRRFSKKNDDDVKNSKMREFKEGGSSFALWNSRGLF
jgi:hypothetical protein